jgi:hypothetical protein
MAGQVGGDHPVGPDQLGDHLQPAFGELPGAVQQHDRRAVAALQHRGRVAGQGQPSLAHRSPGEQAFAETFPGALGADLGLGSVHGVLLLASGWTCVVRIGPARRARHRPNPPACRAGAWVIGASLGQMSPCREA